jgi:hypothetical protein
MLVLAMLIQVTGFVKNDVKGLDVLGKDASKTAKSPQMVPHSTVLGTCKNLSICSGNSGIAKVIAGTIVWWIERKKGQHLVMGL